MDLKCGGKDLAQGRASQRLQSGVIKPAEEGIMLNEGSSRLAPEFTYVSRFLREGDSLAEGVGQRRGEPQKYITKGGKMFRWHS